jgi:phenylacetate-CoA ligase
MALFNSIRYVKTLVKYVKTSSLNRDQVLEIQEQNWRALVRHAHKHSRYYARIMKERNLSAETAQPGDFPVLTKQIIQDHFNEIVTDPKIQQNEVHAHVLKGNPDDLYLGKYYILKTSGSSGQPGYFVFDAAEMIAGITPSIARAPVGIRRRKKKITMLGFPKSFAGSSQTMRFGNNLWIAKRVLDYKAISIEQPFEEVVRQMNEFQPHVVSGYAKLLLLLADAQRKGQLHIRPDSLQSGGEQLLDSDRRYLRDTFQCPVHNHYGSTEGFSLGICRDDENTMELYDDHVHIRIGEEETYLTNLHSFTMPLINYQIRDVLIPRPLAEARPFTRIETTIGRSDEIPYFTTEENGKVTVHPLAFDPIMPVGVKSFFMSCDKTNHVVFHTFIDEKYALKTEEILENVRRGLKNFFAEKNLSNVQFEVIREEDYGVNARTGKTQFWRKTVQ